MAEWVRNMRRETSKKIPEGDDRAGSQCRFTDIGQICLGTWKNA